VWLTLLERKANEGVRKDTSMPDIMDKLTKTSWMDKPLQNYEYIMPHNTEKVQADFQKLAAIDCIKICGYSNAALDKKDIEVYAKNACEKAIHSTKAISLTNDEDMFQRVAQAAYEETYAATQDLFSKKYHLLRDAKHDLERYGEDSALRRIASDLEQTIKFRRK
jgi:hypothetical protein